MEWKWRHIFSNRSEPSGESRDIRIYSDNVVVLPFFNNCSLHEIVPLPEFWMHYLVPDIIAGTRRGKPFFPALTTLNGMPSVLYVDDEPELLTLCRLFLEKDGKITVETARSAVEGIKKLRAGHFDVIISDYLMPESDGVDFLRQVRAEFGNIPFIIFTGKGREEVVIEAINLGVTFYLQKGSDPASRFSELGRKIEIAVHRTKTEGAPEEKTSELDQFFTLALDLLCIADTDGYFRRLNPAWEMTLGWRIDELEGKKFLDLVHPDDLAATVKAMEDLRTGKRDREFHQPFPVQGRDLPLDRMAVFSLWGKTHICCCQGYHGS